MFLTKGRNNKVSLRLSVSSFFFSILTAILILPLSGFALNSNNPQNNQQTDHPGEIKDDTQLIEAYRARKNVFYVEAGDLVVTKLLPDDTSGLPHQKWQAKMSNGDTVAIVYNSDMGDRVPVKVGDRFGVGGQFIWTGNTGLVHWVHDDPRKIRPDGYVYLNGVVYGDTDKEDSGKPHAKPVH